MDTPETGWLDGPHACFYFVDNDLEGQVIVGNIEAVLLFPAKSLGLFPSVEEAKKAVEAAV